MQETIVITSKVQLMDIIAASPLNADLNHLDITALTDLSHVFHNSRFNGHISKWNTSNVENMESTFEGSHFDGVISEWNTGKVRNMRCTFAMSNFNGDISIWNVSNVEDMDYMFCRSRFDGYTLGWNTGKVKTMRGMFQESVFNKYIADWDMSSIECIGNMFYGAKYEKAYNEWIENVTKQILYRKKMKVQTSTDVVSGIPSCLLPDGPHIRKSMVKDKEAGNVTNGGNMEETAKKGMYMHTDGKIVDEPDQRFIVNLIDYVGLNESVIDQICFTDAQVKYKGVDIQAGHMKTLRGNVPVIIARSTSIPAISVIELVHLHGGNFINVSLKTGEDGNDYFLAVGMVQDSTSNMRTFIVRLDMKFEITAATMLDSELRPMKNTIHIDQFYNQLTY